MKILDNDHSYAVMNLVQQIYNCNNITETGRHWCQTFEYEWRRLQLEIRCNLMKHCMLK
jgi:hypothetical protein